MTEIAGRWLRVSTGGQDERMQEPDVGSFIAGHGWTPAAEPYVLKGSASKGKQDKLFAQVLDDIRARRITVLVCWKLDRLDRRGILQSLSMVHEIRTAGGRVCFATEPQYNVDDAGLNMAVGAYGAWLESKVKSDRSLGKHRELRTKGALIGRAPWGYLIEGEKYDKRLVPDPELAEVIREAVRRYLDDGDSLATLCQWLDGLGAEREKCRPPRGGSWDPVSLSQIFRNPVLTGRRCRRNPDGSYGACEHRCPAVLDVATWRWLQDRIDVRAHRAGIAPSQTAMLTSIAFCGLCGHAMYRVDGGRKRRDGSKSSHLYYRCGRPRGDCRNMTDLARLDEYVNERMARLGEPVMREVVIAGDDSHVDRMAQLELDLRELDWRTADYAGRSAAIRDELVRLSALPAVPTRIELVPDPEMTVGSLWGGLDPAGRRDYLLDAGYRLTVSPGAEPVLTK